MITTNDKKAYYEVSEILKYLQDDLKNKIPNKIIEFFETNKSTDYAFYVDFQKGIDEQNLLPQTQEILTILYTEFLCNNSEKELINSLIEENEKNFKQQLDSTNFATPKSSDILTNASKTSIPTELTVTKESFFKRVLSKLKKLFKISN